VRAKIVATVIARGLYVQVVYEKSRFLTNNSLYLGNDTRQNYSVTITMLVMS